MKTKTSNPNVLSRGFVYYTCCMFSWSCIIDLAFFFEVVGIVKDVMRFYLETGEPYFDTSFGALILLSDVLINYPLLLYIIYQIDNKLDCRNAVMFWGGTAVTNLVCLIGGALFGEYRHNMYPASFLNIPYTVIPVYVTCKFLLQPRNFEYQKARSNSRRPILFSFFLAIGMIAVIMLGIVRGLAAFRFPATFATYYATNVEPYVMDPAGFGAVWPMYFMFAGTFILVPMLYGLFHKGTEWMIDWSFIFAGVAINGSYVQLAQFLPGVEGQYHPPDAKLALFINVFIPMLSLDCNHMR
ncbi:unnamed protein product [Clavelina lepadiformis]|uniref:EXPERA domain-containing protein n=1 Tax=Clavelina lepadiformis TaxID=159417 RepID=A0ABP0GVQ1_CLALP